VTQGITILQNGTDESLEYFPEYCRELSVEDLLNRMDWKQNSIKIFGKIIPEPRLTAWYGSAYTYSGIHWPENPFPDFLTPLLMRLRNEFDFDFNSVLINFYRDGKDSMGWHRDNEPEMDQQLVASISVGSTRIFRVKNRISNVSKSIELEHQSLLLMRNFQTNWMHCIPKSNKISEPRINLTFRRIK
jgi:alkylated DNA repair dioxygenase AlkB